jgi:hypothetical protein
MCSVALAGGKSPKIPGSTVEKRVAKPTEKLAWHSSLEETKALAKEQKKPILWLHALGDLEGIC